MYDVKLEQGGYLMGIIAGLLTKSNLIGVVGGVDVSEIHRGHAAFMQGVKSVNPDVKVLNNFVGDFNDLAGAKEAALSQMKAGADVLWQSGDGIGLAVLGACKEKDMLCMGNVANQNELAPDNVVASFVYDWGAGLRPDDRRDRRQAVRQQEVLDRVRPTRACRSPSTMPSRARSPPEALTAVRSRRRSSFEDGTLDLGDLDAVKLEQ